MTLEEALLWEQEILDDIEYLKEELIECRALIVELSEEESGNPHWSDKDVTGGRELLAIAEMRDKLLEGVRADYHYAHYYSVLSNGDRYFATLTEEVDPDVLRMYSEATTRHFAGAIVGATFVLADCYTKEGDLIEGYKIPWNGSVTGSIQRATMKFQDDWTSPTKLNRLRGQAERRMRWIDRDYRIAVMRGNLDAFNEKYPYYIPEDEWNGPQ